MAELGTQISDENIVCPHCGYEHGDALESTPAQSPDLWIEDRCSDCGRQFLVMASGAWVRSLKISIVSVA